MKDEMLRHIQAIDAQCRRLLASTGPSEEQKQSECAEICQAFKELIAKAQKVGR